MIKVKGAWYLESLPQMVIVEELDGSMGMFRMLPARKITRNDIRPYKGHHPQKATMPLPVPEYIYHYYGLDRGDETLSETIRLRVSKSQKESIETYAKDTGSTVSEVLRDYIDNLWSGGEDEIVIRYATIRKGDLTIPAKGEFYGESVDLYFQHPIAGGWMEAPADILQGWSEQDPENQEEWNALVRAIEQDDMLAQKIWDEVEITY